MMCLRLWLVLLLSANAIGFLLPEPPEFDMTPAQALTPKEPGLTLKEQFDVMVENFDRMSDGAKRLAAQKFQVEKLRRKILYTSKIDPAGTDYTSKIDPTRSGANREDLFGKIGDYDGQPPMTGKMTLSDPDKYFQLDQLNAELKKKGEPPITKADAESYWEYTVDYFKNPKLNDIGRPSIGKFLGEEMNVALETMSPDAKTFLADADNAGLLDKMIGAAGADEAAAVYAEAAALRMKKFPRDLKAAEDQAANVRKFIIDNEFSQHSENYFWKYGTNPVVMLEDFRKAGGGGRSFAGKKKSPMFDGISNNGNPVFGADSARRSALDDLLVDLKTKTDLLVRTAGVGGVSGDDVKLLVDAWKTKKRLDGMAQVVFDPADGAMTPIFGTYLDKNGKEYSLDTLEWQQRFKVDVESLAEKTKLKMGASAVKDAAGEAVTDAAGNPVVSTVTDAAGNLVVKADTAASWIKFKGEFERLERNGVENLIKDSEKSALMFGVSPNLPENPVLLKALGLPQDAEAQYISRILEMQREYRELGSKFLVRTRANDLTYESIYKTLRSQGTANNLAKDVNDIQKLFYASRDCKDSGFFALSESDFKSLAKLPATQPAGTRTFKDYMAMTEDAKKPALEDALVWSQERLGIRGELKKALDEFSRLPDAAKDAGKFLRRLQALEGKGMQSLVLSVTGLGPPSADELDAIGTLEAEASLTREDLEENGLDTKFDAWREGEGASQRLESEVGKEIQTFLGDLKKATARSSKQIKKAVGSLSKTQRQILKEIALSDDMREAFGVDGSAATAIVSRTKANFLGMGKLNDKAVTQRMTHCETWVKEASLREGKADDVRANGIWTSEEFDMTFLTDLGVEEDEARSTIKRTSSIVSTKSFNVVSCRFNIQDSGSFSSANSNWRRLLASDCGGGLNDDKTTEDKLLDYIKDQTKTYRKGNLPEEWNAAKDEAMENLQEAVRKFDVYDAVSGESRKFNFDTYKTSLMKNPEAFSEAQLDLFRKIPILIEAAPAIAEGDPALNLATDVWKDVVKALKNDLEKSADKSSVNLVDQNFLTRLKNENLGVDYVNQQADIEGYTTISQRLEDAPSTLVQGPPKLPPTEAELRAEAGKWIRTAGTPEEAALSPELTKLFDASDFSDKEKFMKDYFFSAMQSDVEAQFKEFSADWEANNPGSEKPTYAQWNSIVKSDATPDALPDATQSDVPPHDLTPEEMDAMIKTTMEETSTNAGKNLYSSKLGKSMGEALEDYLSQDTAMAVKYAGEGADAAFGEAMERQIAEKAENFAFKELI